MLRLAGLATSNACGDRPNYLRRIQSTFGLRILPSVVVVLTHPSVIPSSTAFQLSTSALAALNHLFGHSLINDLAWDSEPGELC